MLTKLIGLGRDVRTFRKHRAGAMRGFIKCSDGRLYHPVVAEQVIEGWERKLQQRWRSELARIKKANQRNGTDLASPTYEQFLAGVSQGPTPPSPQSVPGDTGGCPPGQGLQETGTGTGTGTILKKEDFVLVVADAPTIPPSSSTKVRQRSYSPAFEAAWSAYPHHKGRSSKPNAQAEFDRLPPDEQAGLVAAIERFKPNVPDACGGKGAPDMAVWLKQAKHQNWVAGPSADHSREVWQQLVDCWRAGDVWPDRLGPAPDQPGTRVPADLRPTNVHKLHEAA